MSYKLLKYKYNNIIANIVVSNDNIEAIRDLMTHIGDKQSYVDSANSRIKTFYEEQQCKRHIDNIWYFTADIIRLEYLKEGNVKLYDYAAEKNIIYYVNKYDTYIWYTKDNKSI